MKVNIAMVTIWTDDIKRMKDFYTEVLGFSIKLELKQYIELSNEGVRFAICEREVMHGYHDDFKIKPIGQGFELAFPCSSIEDLRLTYEKLILRGAKPIKAPFDTPWNQRCALFADPDGNIHELFFDI